MKKLLFALLIIYNVSFAQQLDQVDVNQSRNQIDFELGGLINGWYQLKYERLLGENISVGLGIGFKGETGLVNLSGLDTDKIKTNDITFSGFKIIPEVRYYINKTQQYTMDGFYFGAYLKYSNLHSDLNGTYINDNQESFVVEFDADFSITSVGFMIGYRLPLSEKISIDFLIAGPGAGFYNFSFENKRDLPDEFYDDLNQALENYSLFDLLNGDFKFSSIDLTSDLILPSLRYGVSIGYSF
jgi:hypothetical protein